MFSSNVINLVIFLSFTYFIGSIILSAINEAISGVLRSRANDLKKTMENLFFESGWKGYIRNEFSRTPTMQSLMKSKGRYPAYIPPASFVQAIICELNVDNYKPEKLMDELKANTSLPKNFRQVLINLYAQSEENIPRFEEKVEAFYNNAMDRATGWYKKKARRTLLILGFLLSVILNIDTIKIVNDALADKEKLNKAVDNIAANLPRLDSLRSLTVTDTSIEVTVSSAREIGNTARLEFEQTTGYSLGYSDFKKEWSDNFLLKLLGVLITAFALQLGSNYWFDILNKTVNIRATGKRPVETPAGNAQPNATSK